MTLQIMMGDDDPGILEDFAELLRDFGFSVSAASNVKDLERLFAEKKPDLLLLDIMFGSESGGPDFYKRVVKSHPELKIPVIYISGLIDAQTESPFVSGAEVSMYAKPIDIEKLVKDIRRAFPAV